MSSQAGSRLKQIVGAAAMNLVVATQSVRRSVAGRDGIAVFAPPSPHKNRGDEALLRSLLRGLEMRGLPVQVFATGQDSLGFLEPRSSIVYRHKSYPAFATLQSQVDCLKLVPQISRAAEIILIGADVVDEGYGLNRSHATLRVLEACIRLGVPARIVSFSMNEPPSQALRQRFSAIAQSCRLFVRDPVSVGRLRDAGIPNITPAGDLAFLLEPAPENDVPERVMRFVTSAAGPVVGLNIIRKVLGTGEVFQRRMAIVADACRRLAEEDLCRFVLIPHDDYEDSRDLAEVSQALHDRGGEAWSLLVDPVPRAALAKRIAGHCTHVFTCRLHLGIATLGMGRPMTGFPYQGKFEGQFDLFGLSHDGLISPDRFPTTVDEMVAMMRSRIAKSEELAAQIQSRLPAVRELSLKNFDGLVTPAGEELR